MNNFEIIKELRDNIVFDKMDFQEALDIYSDRYDRKEFGRLWCKACSLVKEETWQNYLARMMLSSLKEFSSIIGTCFEEGFDEKTISEKLNMPVQFVVSML